MGDHADLDRRVKTYILVFVALLVLTVITVAIARLHLPPAQAVTVALIVASIKGTLVAGYFMHMFSERKLIYWVLGFTVAFFLAVLLLPLFTTTDPITLPPAP